MQTSFQKLGEVYFALCKAVNTPRSLACWLLFREGEYAQLVDLPINPSDYCDSDSFHVDYSVTAYLSKYEDFPKFTDTVQVALSKFTASEELCAKNNRVLRSDAPLLHGADPLFQRAQRKIATLLGDFDYTSVMQGCRWGPGATASLPARDATLDQKIAERRICVTMTALPFLRQTMLGDLHWARARGIDADAEFCYLPDEFLVVPGGRVAVVPKNAKTGRTILIEPTGNLFLQFGVGTFIRNRLRTVGVDLNNQLWNRHLAREGWATIDMKAASDTVYRELVMRLLPLDWAVYLDRIRSPKAKLPSGEFVHLEKFSSMGNGFTFELESLIFWAITQSVCDDSNSKAYVYGDDIVVPESVGDRAVEVLEAFGFEVNRDKSFTRGPFRESCGGHYWFRADVTPIYQKESLNGPVSYFRAYNRLIRLALRLGLGCRDSRLLPAALAVRRLFEKTFQKKAYAAQPDLDAGDDGFAVFLEDDPQLRFAASRRYKMSSIQRDAIHASLLAYTLRFRGSGETCLPLDPGFVRGLPFNGVVDVRGGRRQERSCRRPYPGYLSSAPWI